MYFEEQIDASIEEIRARFQQSMHQVKFGPFDLHKSEINAFSKPWMGQYNAALDEFKLFRTERGTSNTSDFSIKGQLLRKSNHTDLRYSIRPHYMLFFGFIGINIFLFALKVVVVSNGSLIPDWSWLLVALIINTWFILRKRKDFLQSKAAFHALIRLTIQ